jgi:uncharacterized protein (TIGR03382 family)
MMTNRWSQAMGCTVVLVLGAAEPARAAAPSRTAEAAMVTTGRPARPHRAVTTAKDPILTDPGLAGWSALYDQDTGVPLRMWGPGQLAPGTMKDPAIAEAWARAFLTAHLAILAPGAVASDFVVVSNQLDPSNDVRSLGFAQHVEGVPVRGGAISFAFKRDRMIMVGSTALPHVVMPRRAAVQRLAAARATSAAVAWLASSGRRVVARGPVAAAPMIIPIIHARAPSGPVDITYTLAVQTSVETTTGEPGRWNVFVDVATGAPFARESTLMFASGSVLFDVPVRAPGAAAGRHAHPASDTIHNVNGVDVLAGPDGRVSWEGTEPARVLPGLIGPLVKVVNQSGPLTTGNLTLPANGTCTWSHPTEPEVDAQISAFVYANQAKQFAKRRLDPTLAYLDEQLPVHVNETTQSEPCNAYSTGDDIHFHVESAGSCENTARIADVVYHEVGHSLHHHAIINGVGAFDRSMSEGVADTLAAALTGDPGIGRGFFFDNRALRDLAQVQRKVWPRDANGQVHDEGEIYGQTMWDLRTQLEARMGPAGFDQFLKIYYGTIQRAVDIPSCFAEALVADDDDGDLANGTPNDCDIITAFNAHGLFDPSLTGGVTAPVRDDFTVTLTGSAPASATCHAPSISTAMLSWRTRGGEFTAMPLTATDGAFAATIPRQPDGVIVEYRVEVTLSNGAVQAFPSNPADPNYQFQVGTPIPIWCADFENGADGWTHTAMPAAFDRWELGTPLGRGGGPKTAHSGTQVFGTALSSTGRYHSVTTTSAQSPGIDLQGHVNVHLQYYRWLGVEDGYYDQASIIANNAEVWHNFTSPTEPKTSEINHVDQEWRFQDLNLATHTASGNIRLTFALTSDVGFEGAGWNLDDVCLVAFAPFCGNNLLESGERCDDGNSTADDGCSSTCQREVADDPDRPDSGGCSTTSADPGGLAGLALLTLGFVRRRRAGSAQRLPSLR